jgi:hypothetical protein
VLIAALGGACVLLLMMKGPWGQNVRTSEELLAYARSAPHLCFATDRHTLYEIRVLSKLRPPANIVCPTAAEAAAPDALLLNPLNLKRDRDFAAFASNWSGTEMYVGQPAYRDVCAFFPGLRKLDWAVRRPAARVLRCATLVQSGTRDGVP